MACAWWLIRPPWNVRAWRRRVAIEIARRRGQPSGLIPACPWRKRWPCTNTPHGAERVIAAPSSDNRAKASRGRPAPRAAAAPARAAPPANQPPVPADCEDAFPLHVEAHDPVADRQAIQLLAQDFQRFSPRVGIEETPRPESLLLDITGLAGLFGGESRLAASIERCLAERFFVPTGDRRHAERRLGHGAVSIEKFIRAGPPR